MLTGSDYKLRCIIGQLVKYKHRTGKHFKVLNMTCYLFVSDSMVLSCIDSGHYDAVL